MTAERCDHWRGLLALEVVGQLEADDATAFTAHVDGCLQCRTERAGLASLPAALDAADPFPDAPSAVPARLGEAVLTRLRADGRRDRRRNVVRRTLLSGAAAVLVAAAGVLFGLRPWSAAGGRTMVLSGSPGVHATATLFAEPWGTRVALEESGQPGGQVLTMSMRSRSGRWWNAGSYRTVAGHPVHAELACAAPASEVYAVVVRDTQGHTVLWADAS